MEADTIDGVFRNRLTSFYIETHKFQFEHFMVVIGTADGTGIGHLSTGGIHVIREIGLWDQI